MTSSPQSEAKNLPTAFELLAILLAYTEEENKDKDKIRVLKILPL
jgi:hypothetical protein